MSGCRIPIPRRYLGDSDRGPLSDVVLTVSASDEQEATAAPAALTFSPDNWSMPQTVTVRGVDDTVLDGSQPSTIVVAVDTERSDAAFDRVAGQIVTVVTADGESPWKNCENAADIDGDGQVVPLDVLLLVNETNILGSGSLPMPGMPNQNAPPYLDSNGDHELSPLDVLEVIQAINDSGAGLAEGSSTRGHSAAAVRTAEGEAGSASTAPSRLEGKRRNESRKRRDDFWDHFARTSDDDIGLHVERLHVESAIEPLGNWPIATGETPPAGRSSRSN